MFNTNGKFLKLEKNNAKYYITKVGRVNKDCKNFKLELLTPNMSKYMTFTQVLSAENEAEVTTRILT